MTLQAVDGSISFPSMQENVYNTPAFGTLLIDATGEKAGVVFEVPKTGTISKVGFRTGTVTTGDTLKVGLYTVDNTTGFPTATAYGSMVAGTQVVADADDNVAFTVALGTGATATKGDTISAVIEYNSYVAGNMNIVTLLYGNASNMYPYSLLFTTSWAKQTHMPILWLEYSDGTYAYAPMLFPASNIETVSFAVNTAVADEYGNNFTPKFKCGAIGIWVVIGSNAEARDFEMVLYSGTTALATITVDASNLASTAVRYLRKYFTSSVTLSPNTQYRVTIRPTTSGGGTSVYRITAPSVAAMAQLDGGAAVFETRRLDQGAFSDVNTTMRIFMGIMIDQLDDGVGGGGGMLVNSGLTGGMRG